MVQIVDNQWYYRPDYYSYSWRTAETFALPHRSVVVAAWAGRQRTPGADSCYRRGATPLSTVLKLIGTKVPNRCQFFVTFSFFHAGPI